MQSKLYKQVSDGEWVQPVRKGYKLSCCDCGLVHLMNFRAVGGKIQFQAFRDTRATGQRRRHRKISVKHNQCLT